MIMADMHGFGAMDVADRGGAHEFGYEDARHVEPTTGPTPSQTVGPFFAYGLTPGSYGYAHNDIHSSTVAPAETSDKIISIEGQVLDGEGQPIHDALVEIFQADAAGRYAREPRNDGFTGYGRCGTGPDGPAEKGGDTYFRFRTVRPGVAIEGASPFVTIIITIRGLLNHCITRMYFPEDDHSSDPVMRQVPESRRQTLVASEAGPDLYRFDIRMQGDRETVFFDI